MARRKFGERAHLSARKHQKTLNAEGMTRATARKPDPGESVFGKIATKVFGTKSQTAQRAVKNKKMSKATPPKATKAAQARSRSKKRDF